MTRTQFITGLVGMLVLPWGTGTAREKDMRPTGKIVIYNRLDYAPGLHNATTD